MSKCQYYMQEGRCSCQKNTPWCFCSGDYSKRDIKSYKENILKHYTPEPQFISIPIGVNDVIQWIRSCDNLKDLNRVREVIYSAIIYFNEKENDDDFRSRA